MYHAPQQEWKRFSFETPRRINTEVQRPMGGRVLSRRPREVLRTFSDMPGEIRKIATEAVTGLQPSDINPSGVARFVGRKSLVGDDTLFVYEVEVRKGWEPPKKETSPAVDEFANALRQLLASADDCNRHLGGPGLPVEKLKEGMHL